MRLNGLIRLSGSFITRAAVARMLMFAFAVALVQGGASKESFAGENALTPSSPYITDFRLLGPFPWDPALLRSDSDGRKDLEPVLNLEFFPSEHEVVVKDKAEIPADKQWLGVHASNGLFRLHTVFPHTEYQVAFAETKVTSSTERDAALLVEADDGVRVWLNGDLVFSSATVDGIQQFKNYVPVRLLKGENRIVLKLARTKRSPPRDPWNFAIGLRSFESARKERAERVLLQELTTPIVEKDGALGIDLRLFESTTTETVELSDRYHKPLRTLSLKGGESHSVNINDLPPGLYFCSVKESAVPEPFPFLKGDIQSAYDSYSGKLSALLSDPVHAANLQTLNSRFNILMARNHSERQDNLWQAKIAQLFSEWSAILDAVDEHRDAYRDVVGLHLRGFYSAVDGQLQSYILYIPKSYRRSDAPIPLEIVVPYFEASPVPFLMSVPVAEASVLAMMGRAADQDGIAFLWLNNRGNTGGSDFGDTDMFAALEQVEKDYAIDLSRLYLYGACSGGREALTLAAKYPSQFAAIGVLSPFAIFGMRASLDSADAYAKLWAEQKSPVNTLGNLLNIPIYDIHGDQDFHTPLRNSYLLQDAARKAGVDFHLEVVRGGTDLRFPSDPRVQILHWFRGKRSVENPDHVVLTTTQMRYNRAYWLEVERLGSAIEPTRLEAKYQNGQLEVEARNVERYRLDAAAMRQKSDHLRVWTNGVASFDGPLDPQRWITVDLSSHGRTASTQEKRAQIGGPLSDAFTGPFLVVVGSRGDADRVGAAKQSADQFVASWQERYFVGCRVKRDDEVSAQDLQEYNLVLFGDAGSNQLLAKIAEKLPFRQTQNRSGGPSGMNTGTNLSMQYIYPNPLNPERYVLVVGNPLCKKCPADAIQFTLKGWYDYAIWKWSGNEASPVLQDVGRFDQDWLTLLSHFNRPDKATPSASRQ